MVEENKESKWIPKYEENHILNDFENYWDYVEEQYQSGYVASDDELFFTENDFKRYKKLQKEFENEQRSK